MYILVSMFSFSKVRDDEVSDEYASVIAAKKRKSPDSADVMIDNELYETQN